jgi:hypothetical protein
MKDQTPEGESKESEPKGIAIIRPENSFFYNSKTPIHRCVYPYSSRYLSVSYEHIIYMFEREAMNNEKDLYYIRVFFGLSDFYLNFDRIVSDSDRGPYILVLLCVCTIYTYTYVSITYPPLRVGMHFPDYEV